MFALLNSSIGNRHSAILLPVYISLAAWFAALTLLLLGRRLPARGCWTAGSLLLLSHIAAAFQWAHHWSHAAAWRHTADQTAAMTGWNWGGGLWLNYLAAAVWLADAAWWWIAGDDRYRRRPRWLGGMLHAFLAFMWFNGSVVFAQGPLRYLALITFAGLIAWLAARRRAPQGVTDTSS